MYKNKLYYRVSHRNKQKLGQYMKQNLICEKIAWFRDNLDSDITVCTADILENLISTYLSRFDVELEQIKLKHSIGNRKNRQHASREDIINLTRKREREEYNGCGFEIPDFLNSKNLLVVRKWNGELRFLQNIKMKRYNKKILEQLKLQDKIMTGDHQKSDRKSHIESTSNAYED